MAGGLAHTRHPGVSLHRGVPLLRYASLAAVLIIIRVGRKPAWLGVVFRLSNALQTWAMLDVFLLGVAVAYALITCIIVGDGGCGHGLLRRRRHPHTDRQSHIGCIACLAIDQNRFLLRRRPSGDRLCHLRLLDAARTARVPVRALRRHRQAPSALQPLALKCAAACGRSAVSPGESLSDCDDPHRF